jgi:hypothetical protein
VTLNGALSTNGNLSNPATLTTLAFSNTTPGFDYRVAITGATAKTITLGAATGVTYKALNGDTVTSIDIPTGDCHVIVYQESGGVRKVAVLDGVATSGTGSTVTDSTTNGNIVVDNVEVQVYDDSAVIKTVNGTGPDSNGNVNVSTSGVISDSVTNGNIVVDGNEIQVWDNTGNLTTAAAASTYEPIISPKNTGFNKNFGTTAGTVSEGNHTHTGFAATTHNHSITDVTGLQTALDGKAPTVHTHTELKKKATTTTLGTSGTWALVLDEDKTLTAGTLTGNITITASTLVHGMVQVISFKANGSATVTTPAGAISQGGTLSNTNGKLNQLWFYVGKNETGTDTLYFKYWN